MGIQMISRRKKPAWVVESVTARVDYTLLITFASGEKRIYNARPLLEKEIYSSLNNSAFFMNATVKDGTVIWDDDLDIAPEHLYECSVPLAEPTRNTADMLSALKEPPYDLENQDEFIARVDQAILESELDPEPAIDVDEAFNILDRKYFGKSKRIWGLYTDFGDEISALIKNALLQIEQLPDLPEDFYIWDIKSKWESGIRVAFENAGPATAKVEKILSVLEEKTSNLENGRF